MICFKCREREANPQNFGMCDPCDDDVPQAFMFAREIVGDASSDRTTRNLLELPWRE